MELLLLSHSLIFYAKKNIHNICNDGRGVYYTIDTITFIKQY